MLLLLGSAGVFVYQRKQAALCFTCARYPDRDAIDFLRREQLRIDAQITGNTSGHLHSSDHGDWPGFQRRLHERDGTQSCRPIGISRPGDDQSESRPNIVNTQLSLKGGKFKNGVGTR